jgi:hypothetical protein
MTQGEKEDNRRLVASIGLNRSEKDEWKRKKGERLQREKARDVQPVVELVADAEHVGGIRP